jgi:UPF0716 protein FxsA
VRFFTLFALVAVVEMATFYWVQSRIGLGWALLLALATAILGSVLVRRAGLAVWRRIRSRFSQGELPGRELIHGAVILVAGALLISPGFLTDVIGFLLLIPRVRDLIHGAVTRRLSVRVTTFTSGAEVIDVDELD